MAQAFTRGGGSWPPGRPQEACDTDGSQASEKNGDKVPRKLPFHRVPRAFPINAAEAMQVEVETLPGCEAAARPACPVIRNDDMSW